MQSRIADPRHNIPETYWAQVEGEPSAEQLQRLWNGVQLKDEPTLLALARFIDAP
ncbi:hypothetical protein V0R37_10000 [Pollutimonas sp. H1-120]|uniref:hypothetical protein n=1 Tax=Pollutimonas sp. H1-120 TaxID=3148824 RepID=UPI0001628C7D|nr:pseudogene [Bordetella petrii]